MNYRLKCLESFLVIRDLGVQIRTKYIFGRTRTKFIDASLIGDIFINEGLHLEQVLYYLAILVRGKTDLEIIFEVRRMKYHSSLFLFSLRKKSS